MMMMMTVDEVRLNVKVETNAAPLVIDLVGKRGQGQMSKIHRL